MLKGSALSSHIIGDRFYQLMEDSKSIDPFVMEIRKQVKDCLSGDLREDLMLHFLTRDIEHDINTEKAV